MPATAPGLRTADAPRVEVLDGPGLERIGAAWSALWRRCPSATPFQAPEWLLPWARHYAPGRCGATALRHGDRLEGLVPVFAWRGTMMLAGTGPSDYGDWLLAPGAERWADRLLEALPEVPCGEFERIDLRQVPPGSALLSARPPAGWAEIRATDETCLVAPARGEDGIAAASRSCRSNHRQAVRRIGREGGMIELVPAEETAGAMQDLARLHALRWREKGESGLLADPLLDGLLGDAAAELARSGLLRLHRLRFGSKTAAVLLALAGHRAHHYYLSGFDPAYGRLSPSGVLVGAALAQARREGAAELDLLRGCEPYKYRWGAEQRTTCRRTLTRPRASA